MKVSKLSNYKNINKDILFAIVILGLAYLFIKLVIVCFYSTQAAEDGLILLRYSRNFAKTNVIVWNLGQNPVEGATEFLLMILVGIFAKTGISPLIANKIIEFINRGRSCRACLTL